jgi:hypothetical protein
LPFKNNFIPCCDDERCASVETATTSTLSNHCAEGVLCMRCVYLGYFFDIAPLAISFYFFILRRQQIITAYASYLHNSIRESLAEYFAASVGVFNPRQGGRPKPHTQEFHFEMQFGKKILLQGVH